jgi:hypothetical protein
MQDLPKFPEMPDSIRNIMKASIEQAQKAFDTFIGISQNTMTNMTPPNTTPDSVRVINEKIAAFTKLNADANFKLAIKLADAREVGDVLKIQNQHVQELMDTYTKQLQELRDLTMTMMKDTAQSAASTTSNTGTTNPENTNS